MNIQDQIKQIEEHRKLLSTQIDLLKEQDEVIKSMSVIEDTSKLVIEKQSNMIVDQGLLMKRLVDVIQIVISLVQDVNKRERHKEQYKL